MKVPTRYLYRFLGLHSFIIGLFLFYIPVFLFKTGFSLSQICLFISLTGLGFIGTLFVWDRVSKRWPVKHLILVSLVCEWLLLSLFFMDKNSLFLMVGGLFNGMFNCCFWMIQRFLFFDTITPETSGQKFGNFQIFVMIVLKLGIFVGGLLLEHYGYLYVYLAGTAAVLAGIVFFSMNTDRTAWPRAVRNSKPLSVAMILHFKDPLRSRLVFAIDGLFLYLESYFWMVSLFLIVRSNFLTLGVLVIFLAVGFSLLFILIKNRIDDLNPDRLFYLASVLYAASWLMRGFFIHLDHGPWMVLFLAGIAFFTSFFRLAFNKRFFDIAKATSGYAYILHKSYQSQFFLVLIALAGMPWILEAPPSLALSRVYLMAAPLALLYLYYRSPSASMQKD